MPETSTAHPKPTLLLVDDDPVTLQILAAKLAPHGWSLLSASTGVEALVIASKAKPDLIVLDIDMPRMDGFEVCTQIRQSDQLAHIYVIFLSAMAEASAVEQAFEVGGDDFLSKSANHDVLVSHIQRGLRRKRHTESISREVADIDNALGTKDQELKKLRDRLNEFENQPTVVVDKVIRVLEFEPDYYEAGLTILSGFSEAIRERFANEKIKVSIHQELDKITLVIETPLGQKAIIEERLENYSQVIAGKMLLSDFEPDAVRRLKYEQKLGFAKMQLELQQKISDMQDSRIIDLTDRNRLLQQQVDSLQNAIIQGLHKPDPNLEYVCNSLSRIVDSNNHALKLALETVRDLTRVGMSESEKDEVVAALTVIKEQDVTMLAKIRDCLGSISIGVSGNYIYTWLTHATRMLGI